MLALPAFSVPSGSGCSPRSSSNPKGTNALICPPPPVSAPQSLSVACLACSIAGSVPGAWEAHPRATGCPLAPSLPHQPPCTLVLAMMIAKVTQ